MEGIHRYTDFAVKVDQEELPRYLGYRPDRKPNAELTGILTDVTGEAEALARPATIFSIFDAENIPKETHLSTLFSASATAGDSASVDSSVRVVLSICTIGPDLEAKVSEYSARGELARALVLDAAGSSLAEAVCDYANEKICGLSDLHPLYAAPRISPGYGRWNVEEQDIIFRLLPADSIGVTLTKSYMMVPRKSVSFAVRFTEQKPDDEDLSPCSRCGRKECEFRR